MRSLLILAIALAPHIVAAKSPIAEVICAPSAEMNRKLQRSFGEQRAVGLRSPEEMMELWTDAQGDWTLVMTYASGRSCIVAMGENWMDTNPPEDPA